MIQTEIFQADNASGLQREANAWLAEKPEIEIMHVLQSQSHDGKGWNLVLTFVWQAKPRGVAGFLAQAEQSTKTEPAPRLDL